MSHRLGILWALFSDEQSTRTECPYFFVVSATSNRATPDDNERVVRPVNFVFDHWSTDDLLEDETRTTAMTTTTIPVPVTWLDDETFPFIVGLLTFHPLLHLQLLDDNNLVMFRGQTKDIVGVTKVVPPDLALFRTFHADKDVRRQFVARITKHVPRAEIYSDPNDPKMAMHWYIANVTNQRTT